MKLISRSSGDDTKQWPAYLLGRVRTSTVLLIIAFFFTAWLYDTYKPAPPEPAPATQTVPPGFVPDPAVPLREHNRRPRGALHKGGPPVIYEAGFRRAA